MGVTFLALGRLMIKIFDYALHLIYVKYRCFLITSTILLSIPLFLGALIHLVSLHKLVANLIQEKSLILNILGIIIKVIDMLPLYMQLTAMIFGYIRQKEE